MKNRILYLTGILFFAGLFACDKNDTEPTLILNSPPAITSPAAGANIVFTQAEEANLLTFNWTAADFNLKNLSNTTYKLQMDVQGNNFAAPVNLIITPDLNYETTVKSFNNKLLGKGLVAGEAATLDLRIIFDIDEAFVDTTDVVNISVVPYTDQVVVKPIYLLGSATLAGWSNTAALEMSYVDGKFEIVTTLTPGADQYIKFISNLGAWAPQWGTDGTGTWASGTLAYRPTESDPDPAAIPAPDFASQFKIIADTVNLTYEVFEYGDVYLLGGATTVGWDNNAALPMVKTGDGKYTITTTLNPGDYWKIIDERGMWAPQWGTDANGTADGGVLVLRPDENTTDPPAIPSPATAGTFKIDIDIVNLTYTVTPQ
jgi:starch-binding outer membrane protein SusE/F